MRNDLPIDIRSVNDGNKFKSQLKTFLFKRVYELSKVFILRFCDFIRIICGFEDFHFLSGPF